MRVVVTEESHSQATWRSSRSLPQVFVGLLLAMLFLIVLVAFSPSAYRWQVVGAVGALGVASALVLVLAVPVADVGSIERQPDRGEIRCAKVWLFRGTREALALDLEDVETFSLETRRFEDGPTDSYELGRLSAVGHAGDRVPLTAWVEVSTVSALGEVLVKVGRRDLSTSVGDKPAVV
jgi:hypothetical protein